MSQSASIWALHAALPLFSALPIKQAAGVAKNFIRTYMAVAVFSHQAVDYFIDLTQLLLIGRTCRCSDLHDISQVSKEFFLNGLFQSLMAGIFEGQALAGKR